MSVCDAPEYRAIMRFYGDGIARRSGVPLMAHIDDGLEILSEIGASDVTKRAFCLHPIVQNSEPVDLSWSTCLGIAEEYRDRANAYLCTPATDYVKTARQVCNRVGPMTGDCRLMLVADKRQNSKDFELYHACHPRAEQLRRYFTLWLEYLTTLTREAQREAA